MEKSKALQITESLKQLNMTKRRLCESLGDSLSHADDSNISKAAQAAKNGDVALNEKLGNLNASNDPKYSFLLKAALKNKEWRGLIGPNSKIVTLTGTGRTQFINDLRDVQKKIDNPQLIFLTTENKTLMIKHNGESTYSDVPLPIRDISFTADITVAHVPDWELKHGPVLPKAEINSYIVSALSRHARQRRLMDSLDEADLDDKTAYHAVVILPDVENKEKEAQRSRKKSW